MSQAAAIYCIIYCRISEDREGAGLGVDRQEADCRKLAAQLGLIVLCVYADNDISAYKRSSRKRRAGYDQMLADIKAGKAGAVIAWHADRLHRSPVELEDYIDVCQPRGVPTYTFKAGNIDLTTAAGRLIARQLGAVARYQSEHMAEQIQRAKEQRVFNGGNAGGPRPFGFEKDGFTVRQDEAAEVARAAQGVLDGKSLSSLVRDLNKRGILTTQGNEWDASRLRSVLQRPRNAAILVYQGREAGAAQWPPLLPEPTWRQVCAVFEDPVRRTAMSNRAKWLGSNLYLCGKCGGRMKISMSGSGSRKAPRIRGYRCGDHNHLTVAAEPLDAWVRKLIEARLAEPDITEAMEARDAPAPVPVLTSADERERVRVKTQLAGLGTMWAAGEIDEATLKTATGDLRRTLGEIDQRLARTRKGRAIESLKGNGDITQAYRDADLSVQRAVLADLAVITVMPARFKGERFSPTRVRVEWCTGLDCRLVTMATGHSQ